MEEVKEMLRAVINGQSAMKQELLAKIEKVDKKVERLEAKVEKGFKKVNSRIDNLGYQLAELDDDAPTGEEFRTLEKRVGGVERKIASAV